MNQELLNGEVLGTLYGVSENGWITQQLLKEWFHCHFCALPFYLNIRPVLLLMWMDTQPVIAKRQFEWLLHAKFSFAHYHPTQLT